MALAGLPGRRDFLSSSSSWSCWCTYLRGDQRAAGKKAMRLRHNDLLVDEVLHLGQIKSLAVILLGGLLKEGDPVD